MNSKVYRWCAVPLCGNTSIQTPNKLFVFVPKQKKIRDKWLKLARRDTTGISPSTHVYFCEDHFDMPNDMENYMEYHLMGSVSQIRMKPGCMPTRYHCQPDRRKRTSVATERSYILKKQRKTLIEECEKDLGEKTVAIKQVELGETSSITSGDCEEMSKFSTINKRGKPLPWQARQIIANVIEFFKTEAHYGPKIRIANYEPRAIQATGINETIYRNIIMEAKRIENGEILGFCTPIKSIRTTQTTKKTISPIKAKLIRQLVYNLYTIEKKPPTIHSLMAKIRTLDLDFDDDINITVLWHFMRKIGFQLTTTKSNKNRKAIIESYDIRYKRLRYLKQLSEYRQQNRPIIYITESCIDNVQIQDTSKKQPDKNNLLFLLHAGGENGFIPNCLLMSTIGFDNNPDNYRKWIENKLIPNLPPHSVLIIDARFYNIKIGEELTYNRKDMLEWLQNRNVPFSEDMTKPELSALIKTYRIQNSAYKLDEFLRKYGHNVLKLPQYHPELNPMEKILDIIKKSIIATSKTFKIKQLKDLIRDKCNLITKDDWLKISNDVKPIENDYIEKEGIFDKITDELEIPMEEDKDDDDDEDNDDRTMDVEETSDDDLDERSGSSSSSSCSKSPLHFDTKPIKDEVNEPILLKQEKVDDEEEWTEENEWKPSIDAWCVPVKEETDSNQ